MRGRIKAGEGTLIGNAGEFFVMAELLKQGKVAALAPRNASAFDILATDLKKNKTVRIRVKTRSEDYDIWRWTAKTDDSKTIFPHLSQTEDFTVLVNLTSDTKQMDYYIIPTHILNVWLVQNYEYWLATPGKKGQQRSADNRVRTLSYIHEKSKIEPYCNNWDILWE